MAFAPSGVILSILAVRTVPSLFRSFPSSSVASFSITGLPPMATGAGVADGASDGAGVGVAAAGTESASCEVAFPV